MLSVTITEKDGPSTTTTFDKTEVLIGRVKGNDIVLPKSNVSKRHSRIVVKDGKIILIDLKSTNGTFINGRKIAGPHVMQDGDKVYIGDFTIEVREIAGGSAAPVGPGAMPSSAGLSTPGPLPQFGNPSGTHGLPQPPGFPRPSLSGLSTLGGGPGAGLGGPTMANLPSIPPAVGTGPGLPGGPGLSPLPGGPGLNPSGVSTLSGGPGLNPSGASTLSGGPGLNPPGASTLSGGPGLSGAGLPSLPPGPGLNASLMGPGAGAPVPPAAPEDSEEEPLMDMPQPMGPSHIEEAAAPAGPGLSSLPAGPGMGPASGGMGPASAHVPGAMPTALPSGPGALNAFPNAGNAQSSGASSLPSGAAGNRAANGNSSVNSRLNGGGEGVIDKSLRMSPVSDRSAGPRAAAGCDLCAAALPEDIVVDDARTMDTDAWLKAARIVMDKYLNENDFQNILGQTYPPEAETQDACFRELSRCLNECRGALGNVDCNSILDFLLKEACGLGAIDTLIDDASVGSFTVYNFETIVVDRKGRREISSLQFTSNDTLYLATQRLFQFQGINPQTAPAVSEIRFGDGTQLEVILPPVSIASTTIVVRKTSHEFFPLSALVQRDVLSSGMEKFLRLCVKAKRNILIVGVQGSGRTSLLNALGAEIPSGERIVTVENSASLKLSHMSVINLEAQNSSIPDGDMASLIRHSAHLRAERVLVDMIRTPEDAMAFMGAICAGAQGSMATLNSMTADEGFQMLGRMLSTTPNGRYLLGNIDMVICVRAFTDARRRIVEISEVVAHEDGLSCQLVPVYVWNRNGMGNQAMGEGAFRASGNIPRFYRELERGGMALDSSIFNS